MQEWLRTHRGYRRAVRSSTPGYLLASRRDGQESHGALLLLHRKQRRTFELNGSGLAGTMQKKSHAKAAKAAKGKPEGGILSTETPFTVWRLVFRASLSSFFASLADFA